MKLSSCCKLQHRRAVIVNLWENLMLVTAAGYSYQPLHPSSHRFWFYVNLIPNQERKHILLFCAVVFHALHRQFLIHKPDISEVELFFGTGTFLSSHGYLSVVGKWWKQTVQHTDLCSFVWILQILWLEFMENVTTVFALIELWPFLSCMKGIFKWVGFFLLAFCVEK